MHFKSLLHQRSDIRDSENTWHKKMFQTFEMLNSIICRNVESSWKYSSASIYIPPHYIAVSEWLSINIALIALWHKCGQNMKVPWSKCISTGFIALMWRENWATVNSKYPIFVTRCKFSKIVHDKFTLPLLWSHKITALIVTN